MIYCYVCDPTFDDMVSIILDNLSCPKDKIERLLINVWELLIRNINSEFIHYVKYFDSLKVSYIVRGFMNKYQKEFILFMSFRILQCWPLGCEILIFNSGQVDYGVL